MTEKTITDEQILELAIPAINTPQESLKCWLKQVFENQTFTLESLPGDASARRYHRIQLVAGGTDDTTKIVSAYCTVAVVLKIAWLSNKL